MANSDQTNEPPEWLDVLGIDDLGDAGSKVEPADVPDLDGVAAADLDAVDLDDADADFGDSADAGELAGAELDDSEPGSEPLESPFVDNGGQDDEPLVDNEPLDQADSEPTSQEAGSDKEEAQAKKDAEEQARFEERRQRRLKAAEEDDDTGPLIPKGKFLAAFVGLGLFYFMVNLADVWATSRADFEGEATAAVVLGAAQYNGEPSGALQGRLNRAAELYSEGVVEKVVVTGGGQEADITTEAKTGYDYLRSNAEIPDEDLILEVQGATTYEQLAAVARILEQEETTDIVVVTDPYHARRSMLIANEVGLQAQAAVTDNRTDGTRLVSESAAISAGRLISFRRFDAYVN